MSPFNLPARLAACKWNEHELQKWKKKKKQLKTCLFMHACMWIYTVHPSGLLSNTPTQQTEPLDSVAPLIHYKALLIFNHLCLASGPRKIPTGGDTRTEPTLWAPGVQMLAKRLQICKSVSAECVKNTSRNPLVYWKCNEHLRTLWKAEICSWGGPDMWAYPPAAMA